jgi:hypothetical protein
VKHVAGGDRRLNLYLIYLDYRIQFTCRQFSVLALLRILACARDKEEEVLPRSQTKVTDIAACCKRYSYPTAPFSIVGGSVVSWYGPLNLETIFSITRDGAHHPRHCWDVN